MTALVFVASCITKRGPTDVGNQNPRSEFKDGPGGQQRPSSAKDAGGATTSTDHVLARPDVHGRKPRELARATARAIVTSKTHVYFGDGGDDDALLALPKTGDGEPTRIARRAPMPGALAIDGDDHNNARLHWIGSPGDIVLRATINGGGNATTLREGAIFANIAVSKGDVFFTEVQTKGGALTRITGATAARLATFDGSPRGMVVDDQHVFIATSTRLVDAPRQRDTTVDLATGSGFASPQVDNTWLYATAANPKGGAGGRVLVRVKKMGGSLETIMENVRDAPIACHQGSLYWFDAHRPALLSASVTALAPGSIDSKSAVVQTVSDDPLLETISALAVDDDGAFVASGYGDGGRIIVIALR